jgi:hypothetical protein
MTSAIAAYGTLIQMGDGATPTETFATIAEVLDVKGPGWKLATEDATNHSSPSAFEEKIATIKSGDDISFDVNLIPAGTTHGYSAGLLSVWNNRTLRNFKVVFPNVGSTTWTIPCYVTGIAPAMPVKGKLTASISLSIAGAPTLA